MTRLRDDRARRTDSPRDILLVDDEPDLVHGLTRILKARGYLVHQATGGRQAVELAEKHRPHVVLSDIQMPGLNGIETCRLIKQSNPDTAVVFMTGHSKFEQLARDESAVAVLGKPVELERLFEILESLTEYQVGSAPVGRHVPGHV